MNRRVDRGAPARVRRAIIVVAALMALAIGITYLLPALQRDPAPAPDIAATPFAHGAHVALVAGDGHRGARDGAVPQARFDEPWGIARAADGTVYVADGGEANRIRRIAADGTVSTFAGGAEGFADGVGAVARFHTPSALAIDRLGNLYVADTGNHAIRKITPQGEVSTLAGNGVAGHRDGDASRAQFHAPMGVAVDLLGRVYVADTWNDRIRVIGLDGQVHTLAGGDAPGHVDGDARSARFDTPTALALDHTGSLWIADAGNRALRWIDGDGLSHTWQVLPGQAAVELGRPLALVAGFDGNVYVAEHSPGRVLRLTREGDARILAGARAPGFARPSALTLDGKGGLLMTDSAGHRVHRLLARAATSQAQPDDDAIGPSPDRALPDTGQRWPLHPQQAWHEVVGTMGEVRGNFRGESRSHLHNGLDIRGDVGSTVLSIGSGKVLNPISAWSFGGQAEGVSVDELSYVHMRVGRTPQGGNLDPSRFQLLTGDDGRMNRVRIARGTRFRPGDALGTINAQAHVHLIVGPSGHQHNAIRLGFRDYVDTVPPRIDRVFLLDEHDLPMTRREQDRVVVARDRGGIQIVVDAWDQVDGNLPRRRLGLHRLGYQVLNADGSALPGFGQPRINLDFSRMPSQPEAVKVAYAANSGITVHGAARTRFLYVVSNTVRGDELSVDLWQPSALPAGDYLLRIHAEDAAGNVAIGDRDLPLRLVDAMTQPVN